MTFAGCASFNPLPVSTVAASSGCGAILKPVAPPAVKEGDDLRASVAETRAALAKANHELDSGRGCLTDAGKGAKGK